MRVIFAGTEITRDNKIVAQSHNLRGIVDYARNHHTYVTAATVTDTPLELGRERIEHGAILSVQWADGATCKTAFASFTVAKGWLASRRSWTIANDSAAAS